MLTLENDHLVVDILDPFNDQDSLGARYCTGGYIFQLTDKHRGPLLTGPTYPESFNTYDGQGIPDSFSKFPLRSSLDQPGLVLGVGICDITEGAVIEPCVWNIEHHAQSATFTTTHDFHVWSIELRRTVTLDGRTIQSHTSVRNTGGEEFPMLWFPHPFFPQMPPGTDELIKVNGPVAMPENEGYDLSAHGYIRRKGWPWARDHYQMLDIAPGKELLIIQQHPALGLISASCDYAPAYFPIWGNTNTFSWEPMIERIVAPARTASWQVDYDF